ncbi:MAG: EAL domain-containing protein [Sterolibacterium sp.]
MNTSTPCRILLVEDDPSDAHLVRQILRSVRDVRFEITWVGNLAEARQQLLDNPPELILLDLSLPDSSGLATVIAGRQAAGALPLIVLTGHDDTGFALQTLEAGAQDYLLKGSFDGDSLARAIRYALSRAKLEQRLHLASRVFETTGEAIMVTDGNANIIAVNPAFCRITGYSEAEVLGRNPRFLNSDRHDKAFHAEMWRRLLTDGEWAGEVWNRRKNGDVFPEWQTISRVVDAAGQVSQYIAVFADLSEIRQAQDKAERLSWRDALTGLANRALFLRQLDQTLVSSQRDGSYASVLLLDLDRFKDINEARGLGLGDALLKTVAERLNRLLEPDDLLARLDSDEFALLLPRHAAARDTAGRDALALAEKFRTALREDIHLDEELFHLDASIGIALFPDSMQEGASDVLRQADMAMHQAKAAGGGCVLFFETDMGEKVRERYQLERELREAVEQNQLCLYLQPQVERGGRQVGAEALVRWQHPERGLVPPGVFIPLAETSDLIVAVDRWMLGEVCRLLARLDGQGCSLRVSVNVSPRHFQKDDFVAEVKRLLALSGADPNHLVLEVTEGLVIGDFADVVGKMMALTLLGIHFSMDDFGTGYSSLAYLKRLPIQELKIDKSFIQDAPTDPNDAALVEAILAVADHLHLRVVAEGVETASQAEFLDARGKVIHQGYLYGRPEPVEAWLRRLPEETAMPSLNLGEGVGNQTVVSLAGRKHRDK